MAVYRRWAAHDLPQNKSRDNVATQGVASEAASLAGHLQLGNLICIYDDNHITIDGDTAVSFTEDVEMRFKSCTLGLLLKAVSESEI